MSRGSAPVGIDGALTELLIDLAKCCVEGLQALAAFLGIVLYFVVLALFACHNCLLSLILCFPVDCAP
jgi:hypothetical protein